MSAESSSLRSVCVFCGSNPGADPAYARAAEELGRLLAERRLGLVYGGGNVGLMGIIADAVLAAGGRAVGVIPRAMLRWEVGHGDLHELHVVDTMHERKHMMHELSDAFVAMPGGIGTLEELFETLTWLQIGVHGKACGVLNVAGYYDPMLAMLDRAVEHGFLARDQRRLLHESDTPVGLLDELATFEDPKLRTWHDAG